MFALTNAPVHRMTSTAQRPAEPAIDLAHLGRMTLGERSLETEVLQLFDRQAGILRARMDDAAPEAVGALAHTLKGSARGIGAWGVAEAAEAVEAAASGISADNLADALARLSRSIGEARTAIARHLRR
jgi:hypothetical protein